MKGSVVVRNVIVVVTEFSPYKKKCLEASVVVIWRSVNKTELNETE